MYSKHVFGKKRSLPHVLQNKTGIYDTNKSQPDRCSSEVAKIGKHGFSACHGKKYAS